MLSYESIEGHKDCMGRNRKLNQLFPTVCLHQKQPERCKDLSWKQLYELVAKKRIELCLPEGIIILLDKGLNN